MIIIKLFGGLGNQMFQYAIGRELSIKTKTELYLDIGNFHHDIRNYELDIFNIHAHIATQKQTPFYQKEIKTPLIFKLRYPFQWICKKLDHNYVIENSKHPKIHRGMYDFNPKILDLTGYKYLEGNRQSEKYFKDVAETIRKDFTLKKPIDDKQNMDIIQKMGTSESVSLHVRRGDYLGSGFGGICEKPYYEKAIDYIRCKTKDPHFFVFSEDIERCKKNLDIGHNAYFINRNTKKNSYKDFILMSNCKHNIIANSSFSWRGARLNPNPGKIVVSPIKWHQNLDYKDIIPESRIGIG